MRRAVFFLVFAALTVAILLAPWPPPASKGHEREILVRARQYAFAPGAIRVPRGERITLVLEAEDMTHGLMLDGHDVRLVAVPGQRSRATFVADRTGKFIIRCSKICGALHPFMVGKLVVEPNLPWWRVVGLTILVAAGAVTVLRVGRARPLAELA